MVGPRSTGCITCRQRKIRCDEEKPTCLRCERSGLQCQGYYRGFQWKTPETSPKFRSKSTSRKGLKRKRFDMPGLGPVSMFPSPPSFNDGVYCTFFLEKQFAFGNWNSDLQDNRAWITDAFLDRESWPMSYPACRALVIAFFGNVQHNLEMRKEAYVWYKTALAALRQRLEGDITFDLLASIALLGTYEACIYTSDDAWRQHLRALKLLFQAVGPEFFRKKPARSLFMWCRFLMITDDVKAKQPCFLADKAWMGILKSNDREASLTVKLGEIAVHAPELYHEVAEVRPNDTDLNKARTIFDKLKAHLEILRSWWEAWSTNPLRLPSKECAPPAAEDELKPPPPFPGQDKQTRFSFRNLEAAAGFCRYHTHVILALQSIKELVEKVPMLIDDANSKTGSRRQEYVSASEIETHALAIVEALPMYALPQYRQIGALYMTLPARAAYGALPKGSPHSRWIEEFKEYLGTTSGYTLIHHADFGAEG